MYNGNPATMKKLLSQLPLLKRTIWKTVMLLMLLAFTKVSAQIPQGIPYEPDRDPINLRSPWNILLFIVLPVILFVFYYYWRKKKRRNKGYDR